MNNIFSSLITSAGAFQAFDRSISVIQNNVTNSTTPGYAKLRQSLTSLKFDTVLGYPGGILAGEVLTYRDLYAEKEVRSQNEAFAFWSQRASSLNDLETQFPVSDSGIPAAMSDLYEAFSDLTVSPNSTVTRQAVLDAAGKVATEFNQAATGLNNALVDTNRQIKNTVNAINSLVSRIRGINEEIQSNFSNATSSGLDSQLNSALEELSAMADISTVEQDDGSVTVLLGGQVPLVIGSSQYEISADTSAGSAAIIDAQGNDVTERIDGGKLGALLEVANETIPSYQSELNRLAEAFADRVNLTLAEGIDSYGLTPTKNLFTYSSDQPAASLAVGDLLPEEIAAASPDAINGNGNALALAALVDYKELDGLTFTEFYGRIAGQVGTDSAKAQDNKTLYTDLLAQAEAERETIQGVSLDEEAATLIMFQRAYEATARVIQALDEMTQTIIQMV